MKTLECLVCRGWDSQECELKCHDDSGEVILWSNGNQKRDKSKEFKGK